MPWGPAVFMMNVVQFMMNVITSFSLNFNIRKIFYSSISALERAHFGTYVTYVRKMTFSTLSPVAPHCSLQCGIIAAAAALGSPPTRGQPDKWTARETV